MSLGKAVIATSIGAEGINYTQGVNIMIADTPEDFLDAVAFLYQNPDQARMIGDNARMLIGEEHSTGKIIGQLLAFYREIL